MTEYEYPVQDKLTLEDYAKLIQPMVDKLALDFIDMQAAFDEILPPIPWYRRVLRKTHYKIANGIIKLGIRLGGDYS